MTQNLRLGCDRGDFRDAYAALGDGGDDRARHLRGLQGHALAKPVTTCLQRNRNVFIYGERSSRQNRDHVCR